MVEIVDRYGRPFERETLDEPQTASMVHLHREFAGHPTRGLTPSKLARILDDAEQGDIRAQYEAFEDMEEKDGHVASEMGKRRRAVAGLEWTIEPPVNPSAAETNAAARMAELVAGVTDWNSMLFDATDAIGKGFVCLELEWHRVGRDWLPRAIDHRPQTWFQLYRGRRQEVRLRDASADGAPLNPFGWITHVHRAKSGYIERAALMRVLIWPFVFKNYSVGDLAEFLEIYGIPMRLGKYPSGASEVDKRTLMRALVHIGHNAAGIIPAGMEVDFHDIANGDAKAFEVMLDWCERTQSKAILGGTLTSQADRGSNTNALGNVHNDVRIDLRDSDALQVAATITRDLIYPLAALNGLAPDGPARAPRLVFNTRQPEDLKLYADALPKLVQIGFQIPVEWAQQQLRVPKPKDGEAVLMLTPTAAPGTDVEPATAAARSQVRFTAQPQRADAIADTLAELLEEAADPIVVEWVDQIRELLASAGSIEEFRDALLAQFEELPTDQLQTLMRQALMGADLAGRSVVKSQASGRNG